MSESEQNPQNPAPTPAPAVTQATEAPSSPIKKSTGGTDLRQYTMIIYILYIAAILVGITSIVGVIMAYIKRADFAGTEYADHITYLIRTFWISLIGYLTWCGVVGDWHRLDHHHRCGHLVHLPLYRGLHQIQRQQTHQCHGLDVS